MHIPGLVDLKNLRLTMLVVKRHKSGVVGVLFYGTMCKLLQISISNYRDVVVCAKLPGTEPLSEGVMYAGFGRVKDNVFIRKHFCYITANNSVNCSVHKGLLRGLDKRFNMHESLLPPYQSGFD